MTRTPPQSPEAEAVVLGAALLSKSAAHEVVDTLSESDFYSHKNIAVFNCIKALVKEGVQVDAMSVHEAAKARGVSEMFGGAYYLSTLTQSVASTTSVSYFAGIVRDKAILRGVIQMSADLSQMAFDAGADPNEIRIAAEKAVFALRRARGIQSIIDIGQATGSLLERLERAQRLREKGKISGIPSGFQALDRVTGGWQPTNSILVAARPSVGKSSIMMEFAINSKVPCLVFSLEMSAMQFAERLVLSDAEIDSARANRGLISDEDWVRMTKVAGSVGSMPIYIDERGGLDIEEIRSVSRQMVSKHGIKMVMIDYMQLATANVGGRNREQEVAAVSRGIKAMAKELEVSVIALAQLNRIQDTERPDLSSLRESGALEQDADQVLFLWREPNLLNGNKSPILNLAMAKNRHGGLCGMQLIYKKGSARLLPYEDRYGEALS